MKQELEFNKNNLDARTWILHTSKLSLKIMWRKMKQKKSSSDKYNILGELTKHIQRSDHRRQKICIFERSDQEYHSIAILRIQIRFWEIDVKKWNWRNERRSSMLKKEQPQNVYKLKST